MLMINTRINVITLSCINNSWLIHLDREECSLINSHFKNQLIRDNSTQCHCSLQWVKPKSFQLKWLKGQLIQHFLITLYIIHFIVWDQVLTLNAWMLLYSWTTQLYINTLKYLKHVASLNAMLCLMLNTHLG